MMNNFMRGGTLPNPERKNHGKRIATIARMLGTPLIPWQQYVANVATEIDPDTGSFYYNRIVLSTPRQCGKSALTDCADTYNASLGDYRRIIYTAQTGKDAEDHFKDYTELLKKSKLKQKVGKFRFSNGGMSVQFKNRSTISPMAMTKIAGHGKQLDKITLDEAFSLSDEAGKNIIDALVPTMNTRFKRTGVMPQIWITSTEGTSDSTFFNEQLDKLRAGDVSERTCWFDFGIPDDADPEDLDTILRFHPAAGYLWDKSQLADFREQFGDNVRGWARDYGNRRDEGIAERMIPVQLWESTTVEPINPAELLTNNLVFAIAVDVDATHTSISAGMRMGDTIQTQLVTVLDGTGTAPNEILRLADKYNAPIVIDAKGTSAALSDRLHAMTDDFGSPRFQFCPMTQSDYLTIGQAFVSGLENNVITHARSIALDDSAANSGRTWSGDMWRITRRGSSGLTSPLESTMLAAWGVQHMPVEQIPVIV